MHRVHRNTQPKNSAIPAVFHTDRAKHLVLNNFPRHIQTDARFSTRFRAKTELKNPRHRSHLNAPRHCRQ